jgi:outer membrane protein assembly factor BamB
MTSRARGKQAILAAVVAATVGGLWLAGINYAQTRPGAAPASQPKKDDTPPGEAADAPKRPQPNEAGGMMDRAADSGAQVYVDDSFASVEQIRTAQRLASQGQSQLAIQKFQEIIDKFGQKLVYLNNDSYISITDYVRERLLNVAAVRNGMYDQLFGQDAKKQIDAAATQGDLAALVRVCDRYFPSTAAFNGLVQAGEWYFERGEFASASRIWQKLLTHPMIRDRQPDLLFRAALAEHLGRDEDAAKKLRDRLDKSFPDATGAVAGKEVTLLAALDEALKIPAFQPPAALTDEWPAFGGGPAREGVAVADSTAGARLWGVSLTDPAVVGDRTQPGMREPVAQVQVVRSGQVLNEGPALSSYPVLSNGILYVNTGERLLALSANAGTMLWNFPQQVLPRMSNQQLQMVRGNSVARPAAHDSPTVFGDDVYAVLPAKSTGAGGEYPYSLQGLTRIVCLNRETGKERWSTSAQTIVTEADKAAAATPPDAGRGRVVIRGVVNPNARGTLTFIGSPLVTRQGVYAVANRSGDPSFLQYYLVRLDRDTGEVSWSCYLCSAATGAYYTGYTSLPSIPVPALVDDVVYVSTGQGADCAVDANVGRILWLQVTEGAKSKRNAQDFYVQREGAASWKFNPPLAYGDKLIAYETSNGPGGSAWLRVYDRWSGKVLKTATKSQLKLGAADVLAGIVDDKLILTGQGVSAIPLENIDKDPEVAWTVEYPPTSDAGKPAGRPFLTTTMVYIPFDKGLYTVDVKAGKKGEFWPWPKTENDVPGKGGNLLVTSEQVVVVNDQEIAGYSRWETARDNRLADIKAKPNAPEPYLALAEISFRTSHLDLAEENMRKAVELANAASSQGNASEILGRLYRTNLNFAQQLLGKPDEALRQRSRFYYDQCKITARGAEEQTEWRLAMSDLSLLENKPAEAAALFNDVLTDPSLRAASFHKGDAISRGGVVAEMRFRTLIEKNGAAVYKPYEDQAAQQLAAAGADPAALQRIVDNYPNSAAAVSAATRTAAACRDKSDFEGERKALIWLYPRVQGDEKGKVTGQLAQANLALKKFGAASGWTERGLRQFKNLAWTQAGQQVTFDILKQKVRDAASLVASARRPLLPPPQPDDEGRPVGAPNFEDASSLAPGTLLDPIEISPVFVRPDRIFIARSQRVRVFDAADGSELTPKDQPLTLPLAASPVALLGCYGDIAVLVQNRAVVGVDLQKMEIAWKQTFNFSVRDSVPESSSAVRLQQLRAQQLALQNGVLVNDEGVVVGQAPDLTGDPELDRQTAFAALNRPAFSTMKMVGGKLLVVSAGALRAYDLKTGQTAWKDDAGKEVSARLPDGAATVIDGNDDLLVVQVDRPEKPGTAFVVIDADTGKQRRQITLNDEHAYWRGLSDDGMLFVVSDQAVAAYDLLSDADKPAWRRSDLTSKFPAATQITLDGLVFVNAQNEVSCLSADGGEARWPDPTGQAIRLTIPSGQSASGQMPFLRSRIDGDMVIFQSAQGVSAYFTYPRSADDGQLAWEAIVATGQTAPLDTFELSDPYVVVMAKGPMSTAQRAVQLIFINHKGGKRHLIKQIKRSTSETDLEGPVINRWALVDNGVVMEVNGTIYFYHGKPAAAATQPAKPGA